MRKLYEIQEDLLSVLEGYQSDEEGQELPDIHTIEMEATDKIKACLHVCNTKRAEIIEAEAIIDNAMAYIKIRKSAIERIENDVMLTMEMSGLTKIDDPELKVTIPKPSVKLYVESEKDIPEQYFITVPATLKLDNKSLLAAAKEAAKKDETINGVKLIPTKVSLRYSKPKSA